MPYIIEEQRPYWDQFINPFLDELLKPGATPPSQGGLNYALSRIVWAIFNHFPSYQVGSALRAVLIDVHDEFTRRKFNPYKDSKIVENGDLPEGPLAGVFPEKAATKTGTTPCTIESLPKDIKVVKLSQVMDAIQSGKTINEIFAAAESATAEDLCEDCKAQEQPQAKQAPPAKGPHMLVNPGCGPYLLSDPAVESDAEEKHLLALKAFSIAQLNGATAEKLTELSSKIGATTKVLLKIYKGEKL